MGQDYRNHQAERTVPASIFPMIMPAISLKQWMVTVIKSVTDTTY